MIGSVLRWQCIEVLSSLALGVFIVNQIGVLVAGIATYRLKTTENQRLFWVVGFAGGYTTLSSFAFILHGSTITSGILYAFASFVTSLVILFALKKKERL